MNTLMGEMKRSLKELDLGLKGELTMTSEMENLSNSLFFDQVLKVQNLTFQGASELDQACICLSKWFVCLVRRPSA